MSTLPGRSLLPGLLPQPPAIQTTPHPPLYRSSSRPDPVAPPVTSFADNLKPWESSLPTPSPEEIGWATTLGHTVHIGCSNENYRRCTIMESNTSMNTNIKPPGLASSLTLDLFANDNKDGRREEKGQKGNSLWSLNFFLDDMKMLLLSTWKELSCIECCPFAFLALY